MSTIEQSLTVVAKRLQIPPDATVLFHTAFRPFSVRGFSLRNSVDALCEYFAPGTVLFPTMSWRSMRAEGATWDELSTPSHTGLLNEEFRTSFATQRSIHPTHSVAGRGALSSALLSTHQRDQTPCGANSPFGRLASVDGFVVMLSVSFDCLTLLHHLEEIIAPHVYVREEFRDYQCTDRERKTHTVRVHAHRFMKRDFWQFQDAIAAKGMLRTALCDGVLCRAFKASELISIGTEMLRKNPQQVLSLSGGRYRRM